MRRQIKVEVPMYEVLGYPDDSWKKIISPLDVHLVLYGGYPGSALNGGRLSGYVDIQYASELMIISEDTGFIEREIQRLRNLFKEAVTRANRAGIGIYVTFSNYFCVESELNEINAEPLYFMIQNSRNYGVRNGVIVANDQIEDWVRNIGRNELDIVCSCTRFFRPERLLTRAERLTAYHEAVQKYDSVVLTPMDSTEHSVLSQLDCKDLDKLVAIINSSCNPDCNSFWHYAQISSYNLIISVGREHPRYKDLMEQHRYLEGRTANLVCHRELSLDDLERRARRVLTNGIRTLKIAREKQQGNIVPRLLAFITKLGGNQT